MTEILPHHSVIKDASGQVALVCHVEGIPTLIFVGREGRYALEAAMPPVDIVYRAEEVKVD